MGKFARKVKRASESDERKEAKRMLKQARIDEAKAQAQKRLDALEERRKAKKAAKEGT